VDADEGFSYGELEGQQERRIAARRCKRGSCACCSIYICTLAMPLTSPRARRTWTLPSGRTVAESLGLAMRAEDDTDMRRK